MAKRITLNAVNHELARLGYTAHLAKGGGYFYFHSGEAAEWLDRTVNVETIGSHTVEQWIDEFKRLEKLNGQIIAKPARKSAGAKRRPNSRPKS
jgi:hypothetical protein